MDRHKHFFFDIFEFNGDFVVFDPQVYVYTTIYLYLAFQYPNTLMMFFSTLQVILTRPFQSLYSESYLNTTCNLDLVIVATLEYKEISYRSILLIQFLFYILQKLDIFVMNLFDWTFNHGRSFTFSFSSNFEMMVFVRGESISVDLKVWCNLFPNLNKKFK